MTDKKQLHKQAIILSLNIFLSGFVLPLFTFNLKYIFVLTPMLILTFITIILNYLLKPDLSQYIISHSILGLFTGCVCFFILGFFRIFLILIILPYFFIQSFLFFLPDGESIFDIFACLFEILYWIVPVFSLLMEIGLLIKQRVYKKWREFLILIVSHTGICLIITYIVGLFVIGAYIF